MQKVLVLSLALAALPFVSATHDACDHASPAVGVVSLSVDGDTYYVDADGGSVAVYHESNGIEFLQRGAPSPYLPDDAETCGAPHPTPDERVI